MSIFRLTALLLLASLALAFRLLLIPASDYPDVEVVSPYYLVKLGLSSSPLSSVLDGNPGCVTQGIPAALIIGSSYSCDNVILNHDYIFYAVSVLGLLVIPLWFIASYMPLSGSLGKRLRLVPFFLVFLPSTSYYLVGLHSDVPYSLIGILYVYFLLCLSVASSFKQISPWRSALAFVPAFILLLSFILLAVFLPDSQAFILLFLFFAVYMTVTLNVERFPQLNDLLHVLKQQSLRFLRFQPRLLKRLAAVVSLSILLFSALTILNYRIMASMAGLPGPLGIVGSHYSTFYVDVLTKYPLPFRLFSLSQTAVLRTPSYWGPSIITWSFIALAFVIGSLKLLSSSEEMLPPSFKLVFVVIIFLMICIVAIFPGYSNYKYFISLSPLLVLPFTYVPRAAFMAILLLYLDASFGFLWNG